MVLQRLCMSGLFFRLREDELVQWEYYSGQPAPTESFIDWANELGKAGWELVFQFMSPYSPIFVFKRPKN